MFNNKMKQSVIQILKSKLKTSNTDVINSEWYKEYFNREQAENFLTTKEIGVFVIRRSETIKDSYVLSVRVPKYQNSHEISHYLIVKSKKGYSIRGSSLKEFPDLTSLVTHCSLMRDVLPVMLNLDHYRGEDKSKRANDFFYYSSSTSSLSSDFDDTESISNGRLSTRSSATNLFGEIID
jgi:hypothetical protein